MSNPLLAELQAKITPDASLALWMDGEDLHYAWFGLNREQAIVVLERLLAHVRNNTSHALGPSPTKH